MFNCEESDKVMTDLIHDYILNLDSAGAFRILDFIASALESRMIDIDTEEEFKKVRRLAKAIRLANESEGTCQSCGIKPISIVLCSSC